MTAYASPAGYHRHRCHWCAFVWEHADINDAAHGANGAHSCPCCHRCNWSLGIYVGDEEPRVRNGITVTTAHLPIPIHPDQQGPALT